MSGTASPRSAARWQGWLLSVLLHAAVAGLIVLAARSAPGPSPGAVEDTRRPDKDVTITLWDEPIEIVPKKITPIVVDPTVATNVIPLLQPISPAPPPTTPPPPSTPPSAPPAVAQGPAAIPDPGLRHVSATAPPTGP